MKRKTLMFFNKIIHDNVLRNKRLSHLSEEMVREEEEVVRQLHEYDEQNLTFGQVVADKVASFGGSRAFIGTFGAIVV